MKHPLQKIIEEAGSNPHAKPLSLKVLDEAIAACEDFDIIKVAITDSIETPKRLVRNLPSFPNDGNKPDQIFGIPLKVNELIPQNQLWLCHGNGLVHRFEITAEGVTAFHDILLSLKF